MMENPQKVDDLGVPLFLETPIYIYGFYHFLEELQKQAGADKNRHVPLWISPLWLFCCQPMPWWSNFKPNNPNSFGWSHLVSTQMPQVVIQQQGVVMYACIHYM